LNTKYLIATIAILFIQYSNFAQKCTYSISGQIIDESTQAPLAGATVILKEDLKTTVSNDKGYFELTNICKGDYHVIFNHIGCEDKETVIHVDNHKKLNIVMPHLMNMLNGVQLRQKTHEVTTQQVQVIRQQNIQKKANKNLGSLLESLVGVTTLKSGNVAKPIIHGLYGSRVMVLNNSVVQGGQQWGADHAPEIDPLMAGSIEVIKGVAALQYQGSGLGPVVNVLPKKIKKDAHIHGSFLYLGETNGWGNNANLSLQQKRDNLGWAITGSLKKYGDSETPDYFLNNTGFTEANIALQLEYNFSDDWLSKLQISSFNTNLGILRGSRITLNESEFTEQVLNAPEPQFTEDNFSYSIDSPRQEVHHHLLKWENILSRGKDEKYVFTYAGQINNREEFEIRRGGRSDTPALSLLKHKHFLEAKHQKLYANDVEVKKGLQYTFTDNTNDADTGVLPLIPDFLTHQLGGFVLLNKELDNWIFELGARYNFKYQDVALINRNTERDIASFTDYFHNVSIASGVNYFTSKGFTWSFNLGVDSRNPDINEFHSLGTHQGNNTFDIGDPSLKQETGIKATLGLKGDIHQKWFFEALVYSHFIDNYIFLQRSGVFRTTVRGTFAEADYLQDDAIISGFDFGTSYLFSDEFSIGAKYSFLRGQNLKDDIPLVNMPPNNALVTIDYKGDSDGFFKNTSLGLEYKYVWRQDRLLETQDILAPPGAYQLLDFSFDRQIHVKHMRLNIYGGISNIFNTTYRNYLNQDRYFADDLGRSFSLGFRINY